MDKPTNPDAVRCVVGRMLMGFTVKEGRIELRFGGCRDLIIEGEDLQAHYCGPVPNGR
jgi:hypothetical protein